VTGGDSLEVCFLPLLRNFSGGGPRLEWGPVGIELQLWHVYRGCDCRRAYLSSDNIKRKLAEKGPNDKTKFGSRKSPRKLLIEGLLSVKMGGE
jgi:hypothetical protein